MLSPNVSPAMCSLLILQAAGVAYRKSVASGTLCLWFATTYSCEAALDPYNYTTGRWLRRDALDQNARFIQFDFEALCRKIVALCPGASSITSYEKKEGGFNRVLAFHTDNAERIVARLPFFIDRAAEAGDKFGGRDYKLLYVL
jgi:hypothetical protein